MEKSKERDVVVDTFLSRVAGILIALFLAFLTTAVIAFAFFVYQGIVTSPQDRLDTLESAFSQCLEMGIYPETCEQIAAEAAGLANDD